MLCLTGRVREEVFHYGQQLGNGSEGLLAAVRNAWDSTSTANRNPSCPTNTLPTPSRLSASFGDSFYPPVCA